MHRPLAHDDAYGNEIMDGDYRASENDMVWIPTARLFRRGGSLGTTHDDGNDEDWALLHTYVRNVFPLLRTESSSVGPPSDVVVGNERVVGDSNDGTNDTNDDGIEQRERSNFVDKSWTRAVVDCTYFSIARCLANPRRDLLRLYQFRNIGPVPASDEGGGNIDRTRARNHHRGKGINRKNSHKNPDDAPNNSRNCERQDAVLLRLRPDLPRSERRAIHQTLASTRRREFDTSTRTDRESDNTDNNSFHPGAAVVVQWSRDALKASQKKRKRARQTSGVGKVRSERSIAAVFCVLRKYQCEHQIAISSLVRALRCRAGDVGLAGIKDMQAITYQYCTLRNVDIKKAQLANNMLGKRVQLSNFLHVSGPDVLLDRGKLIGSECDPF